MTFCGFVPTSDIIEELLYRNKIRKNATIEIISALAGGESSLYQKTDNISKYLILCNFDPVTCEKKLDDILLQYGKDYTIIIVYHKQRYWLWGNTTDMEELFRVLRERYIQILDVDRIVSVENWFSTDDYFSVMILTR
jgi:hypothetical protein